MRFLFFKAGAANTVFCSCFLGNAKVRGIVLVVTVDRTDKAMQRTRFGSFEHRLRSRRLLIGERQS
jgi:hypothetical protein